MSTPFMKKIKKIFLKKVLTDRIDCDIMTTVRERRNPKMTNWYENPEIHAEDYEELKALMAEEWEEEEAEGWGPSLRLSPRASAGRKIGRSFFIYPIDMLFLLCYNDHGGREGLVSYD